ncbi:MAG: serine/threonine protein kinase [bacterium]|nr:serine/threonine protein kinase [bacterium]
MRRQDFGGYRIEEIIGGGMYTKVYRAHSTLARSVYGDTVAIKILYLKGSFRERAKLINQFEREAEIAIGLDHPNIVKVYNFGKYHNQYAIIMEYINGTNLKEILYQRNKFPLNILVRILYEAGQGLAHIHKNNIVHKDVKPDNILVSEDLSVVKITDFGIAKLPGKLWQKDIFPKGGTVTKYGTISYVAPEQVQGNANFCSDIYSFGITIDEVITAKVEVPDEMEKNQEDYFRRIDIRSYRKNTGKQMILCEDLNIPEELKEIIKKATKQEPFLRYQLMDELLDELKKFL